MLSGTAAPIVMVGMAGAKEAVARRSPQFWSRVSQEVEFQPLGADDVQLIAAELCDLKVSPELAGEIRKRTDGNFRQAVVLLAQVEVICRANRAEVSGAVVEMAARGLKAG
jgi:hypothetical protein